MAGEASLWNTDDADARALCRRERDAREKPAASHRAHDREGLAELLEQLEGQRPLTGDDVGIVVGREVALCVPGELDRVRLPSS